MRATRLFHQSMSLVVAKEKGRSGKDSLLVFFKAEGYLLIEG